MPDQGNACIKSSNGAVVACEPLTEFILRWHSAFLYNAWLLQARLNISY